LSLFKNAVYRKTKTTQQAVLLETSTYLINICKPASLSGKKAPAGFL